MFKLTANLIMLSSFQLLKYFYYFQLFQDQFTNMHIYIISKTIVSYTFFYILHHSTVLFTIVILLLNCTVHFISLYALYFIIPCRNLCNC